MAKERYLQELEEEIRKKNEYEEHIKQLEMKENELIEVLQNTNNIEMQALESLKKVLNGDTPDFLEESMNESNSRIDESVKSNNSYHKDSFKF